MSYCNPQKNKKRNAFFYFMLDWKKDAEARGRKFRNGLKDVQGDAECSQTWKVIICKFIIYTCIHIIYVCINA